MAVASPSPQALSSHFQPLEIHSRRINEKGKKSYSSAELKSFKTYIQKSIVHLCLTHDRAISNIVLGGGEPVPPVSEVRLCERVLPHPPIFCGVVVC